MATGFLRTMASTSLPTSLNAAKVPPTTFAEPGPATAVVMPAARAIPTASSSGRKPSMARMCGVTGLERSLMSVPSQRVASPWRPRWQWASTRPGVTRSPCASIVRHFAGALTLRPTATILPLSTRTSPLGMSGPEMGLTSPSLMSSAMGIVLSLWFWVAVKAGAVSVCAMGEQIDFHRVIIVPRTTLIRTGRCGVRKTNETETELDASRYQE